MIRIPRLVCILAFAPGFFCEAAAELTAASALRPRVLAVNSYHDGFEWSDGIMRGIDAVLADAELSIEYLDTKRYSGEDYDRLLRQIFRRKYAHQAFDCIIACDNYAFDFVLEHGDALWGDTPVVFCGVNDFDPAATAGHANVTGVVETIDPVATVKLMLELYPRAERVHVISDRTVSGEANRRILERAIAAGELTIPVRFLDRGRGLDLKDLLHELETIGPDNLIYYADFFRDRHGHYTRYQDVLAELTAVARAPICVHSSLYVGHGAVGGIVVSGFDHGEAAARMASRILEGAAPASIPVRDPGPLGPIFDSRQLARWGIRPAQLPPDSRLVNRPDSPLHRYGPVIALVVAFVALQTLIIGWLLRSIHRRRRIQRELAASESRLRTFADALPDLVLVLGRDGLIHDVPAHRHTRLQRDAKAVIGAHLSRLLPGEACDDVLRAVAETLETGQMRLHHYCICIDGTDRWFEGRAAPYHPRGGNGDRAIWIERDVTAAKQAERSLIEANAQVQALLQAIPDAINFKDTEGRNLLFNLAFERLVGRDEHEVFGRTDEQLFSLATASRLQATDHDALTSGRPVIVEINDRATDGAERCLELVKVPLFDARGTPTGLVSVGRDITERRRTEHERARLNAAVEQAAEMVLITDTRGNIEYVNPAFERITGYARREVIGRRPSILRSGEHTRAFYQRLWSIIVNGHVWTGRLINRRKDGSLYEEEANIAPLRDPQGRITHFVAVKRDITEMVNLEKQLRQTQKMEAIGTLAGGIAHDFNNILAGLLGYTELALAELEPHSHAHQYLDEVVKAGNRAAALVKQILTFSRRAEQERRPMRLQPVIREALGLLRGSLPSTIHIRQAIDDDVGETMADPTRIHQVVMNLCTNAYHAMREHGGVLEVGLRALELNDPGAHGYPDLDPGSYAELTVADNGEGMDPDTVARIFDPYFTTKGPADGTGLGLATVHGIVRGHDGAINVRSDLGRGTTFTVLLPLGAEAVAGACIVPDSTDGAVHGDERILFVDDEEAIVRLSELALGRYGYRVTAVTEPAEAIQLFAAEPQRWDVVVSDLTMPGLTGLDLSRRLLALRPDVPIVMCTGFSEQFSEARARALGIRAFLTKPTRAYDLALVIRRELDRSSAVEAG